jgi:hypothetical protein
MTKYYEEQNRIEKLRQQKADLPIAISGEFTTEHKKAYYCDYCNYKMVKISDQEYFCNHCKTSAYPGYEQLRRKSKITTPMGLNLEPCLSYLPEHNDLSKKPVEIKGGLRALKDRGIKITSYKEGVG